MIDPRPKCGSKSLKLKQGNKYFREHHSKNTRLIIWKPWFVGQNKSTKPQNPFKLKLVCNIWHLLVKKKRSTNWRRTVYGIDNSSVNTYSFSNVIFENFPLGYSGDNFLNFAMFTLVLSWESETLMLKERGQKSVLSKFYDNILWTVTQLYEC